MKLYDARFFRGHCRLALNGSRIHFRLSRRMTSAGGTTTSFLLANGEASYEIAIAASLLFDSFGNGDRRITVGGVECDNRLRRILQGRGRRRAVPLQYVYLCCVRGIRLEGSR